MRRDSRSRAGNRRPENMRASRGRYVDERLAWVDTVLGNMVLMVYPEGHESGSKTEAGETVRILIPRPGRAAVSLDLTHLTEQELDLLQEFFTLAFETARPVARHRDKDAQDAFARGDDSFSRIYRQVPRMVVRERKERTDGQGVQHGSEDVSVGDGDPGGPTGVRGALGQMADNEPEQGEPQDDSPQVDES